MASGENLLLKACADLAELRSHASYFTEQQRLAEADLITAFRAQGIDFCDYAPTKRACLELPRTRHVDPQRFHGACKAQEIDPAEAAACIESHVSVSKAKRLLGDLMDFDAVCTFDPPKPRIRMVDRTPDR